MYASSSRTCQGVLYLHYSGQSMATPSVTAHPMHSLMRLVEFSQAFKIITMNVLCAVTGTNVYRRRVVLYSLLCKFISTVMCCKWTTRVECTSNWRNRFVKKNTEISDLILRMLLTGRREYKLSWFFVIFLQIVTPPSLLYHFFRFISCMHPCRSYSRNNGVKLWWYPIYFVFKF